MITKVQAQTAASASRSLAKTLMPFEDHFDLETRTTVYALIEQLMLLEKILLEIADDAE